MREELRSWHWVGALCGAIAGPVSAIENPGFSPTHESEMCAANRGRCHHWGARTAGLMRMVISFAAERVPFPP